MAIKRLPHLFTASQPCAKEAFREILCLFQLGGRHWLRLDLVLGPCEVFEGLSTLSHRVFGLCCKQVYLQRGEPKRVSRVLIAGPGGAFEDGTLDL